jgi:S1-C subfamily serine protease
MLAPKATYRKVSLFFLFTLLLICSDIGAETLKEFDREIRNLLHRVQSSVVTIYTYRKVGSPTGGIFPFNPELIDTQIGTGVVYDTNGHVLTTGHVVRGGSDFEVFARDGRKFKAVISGIAPDRDIALLQIAPNQLSPLPLRTSDPVAAGSILFAVGNSFGIPNAANLAVAVGYRSNGSLQVSANLAPGFSGGPVVDVEGRMVGLISAKLTEPVTLGHVRLTRESSSGTSAIDFTGAEMELPSTGVIIAISSSDVRESVTRLIEGERSGKGFLGIRPEDMDPAWAARAFNVRHGVIISEVMQNSPAWEAGIRSGDILTQYLGRRVVSSNQLRKLIATGKKGDVVSLSVMRGGRSLSIAVQLSSEEAMNIAGQADQIGVPIDSTANIREIPIRQLIGEDNYRRQMQARITALRLELRRQMKELEYLQRELSRSQGDK